MTSPNFQVLFFLLINNSYKFLELSSEKAQQQFLPRKKTSETKLQPRLIPPVRNYHRREKRMLITKGMTNLSSLSKESQCEYEAMLLTSYGPWIT